MTIVYRYVYYVCKIAGQLCALWSVDHLPLKMGFLKVLYDVLMMASFLPCCSPQILGCSDVPCRSTVRFLVQMLA